MFYSPLFPSCVCCSGCPSSRFFHIPKDSKGPCRQRNAQDNRSMGIPFSREHARTRWQCSAEPTVRISNCSEGDAEKLANPLKQVRSRDVEGQERQRVRRSAETRRMRTFSQQSPSPPIPTPGLPIAEPTRSFWTYPPSAILARLVQDPEGSQCAAVPEYADVGVYSCI